MRVLMVSDVYFPRVNGVSTSIETFRRTLAEQGVEPATIAAACEEAKAAKPGENIPPGYVFAIVSRWKIEGGTTAKARASPRQTTADERRKVSERKILVVVGLDWRFQSADPRGDFRKIISLQLGFHMRLRRPNSYHCCQTTTRKNYRNSILAYRLRT